MSGRRDSDCARDRAAGAAGASARVGSGWADTGVVDATPEPGKIQQMFDGIAGSYDRMNSLMTAGLHHRWRDMGVMLAGAWLFVRLTAGAGEASAPRS